MSIDEIIAEYNRLCQEALSSYTAALFSANEWFNRQMIDAVNKAAPSGADDASGEGQV